MHFISHIPRDHTGLVFPPSSYPRLQCLVFMCIPAFPAVWNISWCSRPLPPPPPPHLVSLIVGWKSHLQWPINEDDNSYSIVFVKMNGIIHAKLSAQSLAHSKCSNHRSLLLLFPPCSILLLNIILLLSGDSYFY